MRTQGSTLAILILALAATPGARAQEHATVSVHGFASQGYLHSSANRILSTHSDEGTFAFAEEGLNFSSQPLPKLRIGAQVFARDLGQQGNHQATIDWALGDYRLRDWLGVRAGKVKLPVGFYNTLIDADVARPEVIQPSGLYPLSTRDISSAYSGAALYGLVKLGAGGDLEYEVWGGTIDLDGAYIVDRFVRDGAAASLPPLARALRLTNADYQVSDVRADMQHHYGGALEWRPPVAGLRLRVSGFSARSTVDALTTYTGFAGPAALSLAARSSSVLDQPSHLFFSAEYRRGGLRLSAEHFRGHSVNTTTVSGLPGPPPAPTVRDERPVATYAQVAYRFDDRWQLSAYYSVAYGDRDDKDGLRFSSRGQPAYRAWQKDWAFSVRSDVTAHWLLKLEFHAVDGAGALSTVENPAGLKKSWNLVAAKTTFHF